MITRSESPYVSGDHLDCRDIVQEPVTDLLRLCFGEGGGVATKTVGLRVLRSDLELLLAKELESRSSLAAT